MEIKKLENIRIVLVEPQVPGNVGSTARAMKNCGLSQLVLVRPWFINHPQSRYMAHSSEDILDNAIIADTVEDAVSGSILIAGTTRRKRHNTPFMNPEQSSLELLEAAQGGPVSILFGREDRGLFNEELKCCQIHVTIPSSKAQPSLNLSQAVMVMCYEIFSSVVPGTGRSLDLAPSEELDVMYDHLRRSLSTLGMKEWNEGDNYMKSLRRVFSRTRLERRDVSTIHKLCGEIDKYTVRVRDQIKKENNDPEID